jgi:hypothetical protein
MTRIETVVRPETLSIESGKIVGEIFVTGEEIHFPERGWNDFPVIVLGWWLTALQRPPTGLGVQIFRFMDGPYEFVVRSESVRIKFDFLRQGAICASLDDVDFSHFRKSAFSAAAACQSWMFSAGYEDRDSQILAELLRKSGYSSQ